METALIDVERSLRHQSATDAETVIQSLPSAFNANILTLMTKLSDIDIRSRDLNPNHTELLGETVSTVHEMLLACEKYEADFASCPDVIVSARRTFRQMTDSIFSKSYYVNRARTWPRGYMGDYLTLDSVYSNTPLSDGVGYYLDQRFLRSTLGTAVRERLSTLTSLLSDAIKQYSSPAILNIACGSCRELVSLSNDIMDADGNIICFDHDDAALDFSMKRLASTRLDLDHSSFRKYNAYKIVSHDRNMKEFGPQDIIYSAGFFDYVKDSALIPMLSSVYRLLKPGGTLIAPFKDANQYRTQEYHWIVDWTGFFQRTPEEILDLIEAAGIPREKYRTVRDKSGVILFIVATA